MRTNVARALARKHPNLRDLRVLVVGLGKSGRAAARLAADHGARVSAVDVRPTASLAEETARLESIGVRVAGGGHPPELANDADLLVLSPGVPATVPLVSACRRLEVPVWSEVELAWRFCRGRVIAITGSNGKSTTTAMVGAILRGAGVAGGTGGNLATPFSELLADDGDDAVHAVELSSFQLETIDVFRADVAAVLNLTPDHLDRYPSVEAYADAKARLLARQDPTDFAIVNADDPASARFVGDARGTVHRFSTRGPVDRGAFVDDDRIRLRTDASDEPVMPARELPIPGEHNVANALVAALACRLVGVRPDRIAAGLRGFRPLPHRLEPVATLDRVVWVNDSKATNSDSAIRAARSFPPGSVVLILGGRDKGADWTELARAIRGHVRTVLLVGEATEAIAEGLAGRVPYESCAKIEAAVEHARAIATPGDVVLLSPGCASFDQFQNFEERGEVFRRAVLREPRPEGPDRA
jgi:UDP-N-acetylmuramoylalanine--D-glutamate ligase